MFLFKKAELWRQYIWTMLQVGWTYAYQNNHESAYSYANKVEQLAEEHLAAEDSMFIVIYYLKGSSADDVGNIEEGISYLKKCLDLSIKYKGADHWSNGQYYNNLGSIYVDYAIDLDTGMMYFQKAIDLFIDESGTPVTRQFIHPATNMAIVMAKKGKQDEAIEQYFRILSFLENEETPDLTALISVNMRIGEAYVNRQDFNHAEYYISKGIEYQEKILGKPSPQYFGYYTFAAALKKNRGSHEEAIHLYEKVLAEAERDPEKHQLALAESYLGLGYLHLDINQPEKALHYVEKAMPYVRKEYGPRHNKMGELYKVAALNYEK